MSNHSAAIEIVRQITSTGGIQPGETIADLVAAAGHADDEDFEDICDLVGEMLDSTE